MTFPAPRKVTALFRDAKFGWMVSVDGYAGAFPMTEIQPFAAGAPQPQVTPPLTAQAGKAEGPAATGAIDKDPIETFLANGRLQINANVGVEGIGRLKQILEKYEELMRLMN